MSKPSTPFYIKNTARVTLTLMMVLTLSALIAQGAVILGAGIVGLVGIPFVFLALYNYRHGLVILFLFGSFMFVIGRFLGITLPSGVLYDILILLMFASIMISTKWGNKLDFKLKEPITLMNMFFFMYFALEILNPNATSISAWFVSARFYTLLMLYFIMITYFSDVKNVKIFLFLWLAIGVFIALYGLQQEFIGLKQFEWNFIHASPERFNRYFNWGHMRVFSILSDPAAFGLFMAFTGLSTLTLAFGPYKPFARLIFAGLTGVIFLSMSFSGTRTAFAMVAVGTVFFIILNIKSPQVLAGSVVLLIGFLLLMYGPFYNGTVLRVRSTFNLSKDASMSVRDNTRIRFQSYIQRHPIGGGVNTSGNYGAMYSPGHPLAGYPPDSGYLKTALELGWIGLGLVIILNAMVVIRGILNHYNLRDPILKAYNMAFVIPLFALTIAEYAQDAMFQKPIMLPVIACYALMIKIKDIDDKQHQIKETTP